MVYLFIYPSASSRSLDGALSLARISLNFVWGLDIAGGQTERGSQSVHCLWSMIVVREIYGRSSVYQVVAELASFGSEIKRERVREYI